MTRIVSGENPLLPASYDLVWSIVVVVICLVLVLLVVLAVVVLVRALRASGENRRASVTPDAIEQVRQMAELRDAGAMSPEEYEARKDRILGPA